MPYIPSTCHICQHKLTPGLLFCKNCGAIIGPTPYRRGHVRPYPEVEQPLNPQRVNLRGYPLKPADTRPLPGSIYFETTDESLALRVEYSIGCFTIGRIDPNTGRMPHIDLTLFDARENVVSRRHAVLHCTERETYLEDTYSTNGTYYDGIRVQPETRIQINNSGQVRFGGLFLRMTIFHPSRESSGR
ncbi:MAG: FHA domain-containing protein [Chloroflexota bacterium]